MERAGDSDRLLLDTKNIDEYTWRQVHILINNIYIDIYQEYLRNFPFLKARPWFWKLWETMLVLEVLHQSPDTEVL